VVDSTTASTSVTTGALVVGGGLGLAGTISVGQNLNANVTQKAASDVLNAGICIRQTAAVATSLPAAPTVGRMLFFKNSHTGQTTISGNGYNIDGAASKTLEAGDTTIVVWDSVATEWFTFGGTCPDVLQKIYNLDITLTAQVPVRLSDDYTVGTSTLDTSTSVATEWTVAIKSGANVRVVKIMAGTDGTNVTYTMTETTSIGSTADVTLSIDYSAGIRLRAVVAGASTWTISTMRQDVKL
jgi:hypothetical protein